MQKKLHFNDFDLDSTFCNNRVKIEVYMDKKILITDYSNLGRDEIVEFADEIYDGQCQLNLISMLL